MGMPRKRHELWQVSRRPWVMGAIVAVATSYRDTFVDVSVSVKLANFCEVLHQPGNPSFPPNTSYEPEQPSREDTVQQSGRKLEASTRQTAAMLRPPSRVR